MGWTIQVVDVEPGTIRGNGTEVWANVDLILSNGEAQPATFHASATADAYGVDGEIKQHSHGGSNDHHARRSLTR